MFWGSPIGWGYRGPEYSKCQHCGALVSPNMPHYCGTMPKQTAGAVPVKALTEEDVRRIVREEIAASRTTAL